MTPYEKQAKDFLKKSKTKLDIQFKEYGSMPWDEKGEQRNIFVCTLSNSNGSYTFDFGSSLADSNQIVEIPQKDSNLQVIEVYAGLKTEPTNRKTTVSAGISFFLHKKDGFSLSDEEFYKLELELRTQFYKNYNAKNQKWISLYESGDISRKEMEQNVEAGNIESGAFQQVIQNAITRELNKPIETYVEDNEVKIPTAYDILTCLTKYDPESFEDFCDNYGYSKDSIKALNTYEAVAEEWENISSMFNEDELAELCEID